METPDRQMANAVCLYLCVFVSTPEPIASGVIWAPYDWLNKFYSFYMAAVVHRGPSIISYNHKRCDILCTNTIS